MVRFHWLNSISGALPVGWDSLLSAQRSALVFIPILWLSQPCICVCVTHCILFFQVHCIQVEGCLSNVASSTNQYGLDISSIHDGNTTVKCHEHDNEATMLSPSGMYIPATFFELTKLSFCTGTES